MDTSARGDLSRFAAYFDESGTHAASPVLVVAGYLSPVEQWSHFEREWRELLDEFRVANPFHMTDFENRWRQFQGWDDSARHRCIDRITGILGRRTWFRTAFAVNVADYQDVVGGADVSPYGFCVWEWMKEAERWLDRYGYTAPIDYVFERGSGRGAEIENNFQWMLSRRKDLRKRYRINSYTFADKRDMLPLQAVDVFAYEAWKHLMNVILPEVKRASRKSLQLLLGKARHHAYYHGREHLEKFERDLAAFAASNTEDLA
jgi:hypothetical protein